MDPPTIQELKEKYNQTALVRSRLEKDQLLLQQQIAEVSSADFLLRWEIIKSEVNKFLHNKYRFFKDNIPVLTDAADQCKLYLRMPLGEDVGEWEVILPKENTHMTHWPKHVITNLPNTDGYLSRKYDLHFVRYLIGLGVLDAELVHKYSFNN